MEQPTPRKVLPSRSSRGTRMSALIGEDAKFDQEFYNSQFFAEDAEDELYTEESESEDEVDEDFDIPEPVEAETEETVVVKEPKKRASVNKYQDPERRKEKPKKKKNKTKQQISQEEHTEESQMHTETSKPEETEGPPKVRKSSRSLTVRKVAEGEKRRQEEEKEKKRKRRPSLLKQETRKLTQEEVLEEAKETEEINLAALEKSLQIEEKQKPVIRKQHVVEGPAIRLLSNTDCHLITFTHVDQVPSALRPSPIPCPEKPVCAVTGDPGRYKDPKTGLWYSTAEAFKILRARYASKENQADDSNHGQQQATPGGKATEEPKRKKRKSSLVALEDSRVDCEVAD